MSFKMDFNRALVISFLWHLFWFFAVTIVILPVGMRQSGFSDISFLGSILDTSSFRREFQAAHPYIVGVSSTLNELFLAGGQYTGPQRLIAYADRDYFLIEKPYKASIDEISETEKKLPVVASSGPMPQPEEDKDYLIEGEARNRSILFKPPTPECRVSINLSQKDIQDYYEVKLKIVIAPDGCVKEAEKLQSSGYPEIDLLALRYIKNWSFAKLNPDLPQKDQQAAVLLKFKSK